MGLILYSSLVASDSKKAKKRKMIVSDEEDDMNTGICSIIAPCRFPLRSASNRIETKTSDISLPSSPVPESIPMKFGPPRGKPKKSSKTVESEPEASENPKPSKSKAKRLSKKKAESISVLEEDDGPVDEVPPSSDAALSADEIAEDEVDGEEEVEELASGKAARKTYAQDFLETW